MAAAADGERQLALARKGDDAGDIRRIDRPDDHGWMTTDSAHEEGTQVVVLGIVRGNHTPTDQAAKIGG